MTNPTHKELFAQANGFEIDDPIMSAWNEEKRDLDISKEWRKKLAKGYKKGSYVNNITTKFS